MQHLLDWFKDSAGILLTLALLSAAIAAFTLFRQFGILSFDQISSQKEEIGSLPMERYNDRIVDGSLVINAIKRCQKETPVTVNNGTTVVSYHGNFSVKANIRENPDYIDPMKEYGAFVIKSETGDYKEIQFIEKSKIVRELSDKEILAEILGEDPENGSINNLYERSQKELQKQKEALSILSEQIIRGETEKDTLKQKTAALSRQNQALIADANALKISAEKGINLLSEIENAYQSILHALAAKGLKSSEGAVKLADLIINKGFGSELANGKLKGMNPEKWYEINLGFTPQVLVIISKSVIKDWDAGTSGEYCYFALITDKEKGNKKFGKIIVPTIGSNKSRTYQISSDFSYEFFEEGFRYRLKPDINNCEAVGESDVTYFAF